VLRLIEVQQPRQHDLIGGTLGIAEFGTDLEATMLWRVLEQDSDVLGKGPVKGVGSME
jgi:hypothetical protein